jgi:CDP-glycerol glycerophosphotransferase (TagB/SpsB family)
LINFLQVKKKNSYRLILNSFIDPIVKHLNKNEFTIKIANNPNCLNVKFFTEKFYPPGDVFISHGIADKNYRNYDSVSDFKYVFVSGNLWKHKLIKQGMPEKKIFITGYTKLDVLFNSYHKKEKNNQIFVLYAPTHTNSPSLENKFERCFDEISKKYYIKKSLHPHNKNMKVPTLQNLIDADVVISDCSSIIYEAWALDKPVVFPDWLVKKEIQKVFRYSFEDYIYGKQLGYHASNTDELLELIKIAYENGIDKSAKVFIENIFPKELRGKSGLVTAQTLMRIQN